MAGARGDQQGRVELRPQHGAELRRRDRLDAVHARRRGCAGATDANGDGVADPWNAPDAIFSAARYLAAAGGAIDIYRAVFAYNHADWYVQEVLGLADTLGADGAVAFTIDRMQENARRCAEGGRRREPALLAAQRERAPARGRSAARLRTQADRAALLSDRLALQASAGRIDERRARPRPSASRRAAAASTQRAGSARARPAGGRGRLARSRGDRAADRRADRTLGGYVFPVGGGPGVVSVSHTHHDYPAADIAAPAGSPLYALADGTVVNAWADPDTRCGIGFTYPRLRRPGLDVLPHGRPRPGGRRRARADGGRSRSGSSAQTGHATGPHLHLQLQPATRLAAGGAVVPVVRGPAFAWSDGAVRPGEAGARDRALALVQAPATAGAGSRLRQGPVFQVVPADPAARRLLQPGGA